MKYLATTALLLHAVSALKMDLFNSENAPSTGQEWVSIGKDHEAQIGDFSQYPPEKAARMRATFKRLLDEEAAANDDYDMSTNVGYDQNFVDPTAYYPDEQQAWRYLGVFVDCNPERDYDEEQNDENQNRDLQSRDEGDNTCARYVLYGVYIDPNYEGMGIGEYSFWDRYSQTWDDSACEATGSSCRKMDCHLPDTEFELLGFFKIGKPDDFMDQLFKHEGYCTWYPEEYSFMQGHAKIWPRGCTPTYINDLYIDLKPMPGGDWSLGIYTDQICTQEYNGRAMSIIEAYSEANPYYRSHDSGRFEYGDLVSLAENIDKWNDAMAFWKQCNPCRAYNIGNGQQNEGDDDDGNGRRLQSGDGDDAFYCADDADYTNVNNCMKFFAKTDLQVATFRNMALASGQGSIVEVDLANGKTLGDDSTVSAYFSLNSSRTPSSTLVGGFLATLAIFVFGAAAFVFAWRTRGDNGSSLKHPLVESEGVVA